MIAGGEGIRRVEESIFFEMEKPTMGSFQLMEGSALQTQKLDRLWNAA